MGRKSKVGADELVPITLTEEELKEFRPASEFLHNGDEGAEVDKDDSGENEGAEEVHDTRKEGRPEPGYSTKLNAEGRLTDEQMDANIEAAAREFKDPHITNPKYVWGMKYLDDMFEKERAQWKAELANVDHKEARRMLAAQEAEEEAREKAEKPRKRKKTKKPSLRKAINEMNAAASEVFLDEYGLDVVEMSCCDDYLYVMEISPEADAESVLEASNALFHKIGILPEERDLEMEEMTEYCTVHRNEYSKACFVMFNHPFVIEAVSAGVKCGDTVRVFADAQRKRVEGKTAGIAPTVVGGEGEEGDGGEAWMRKLAEGIKSGAIRSKSGEGFFVLKSEFFKAIKAGTKTTEYRDITPRNLSMSIGIKTVKLQSGYGHAGKPPEQMRFEVASVEFLDADDNECDPYNIPDCFVATTIAIHLGKRIG